MTTNALQRRENQALAAIEQVAGLPAESLSLVGLRLTDPTMTYEEWEMLGRNLGHTHRWSSWAIGDWLNFGEAIYGEEAAQATEAFPADRYNVAERVTGLAHGTLLNVASQCGKIDLDVRRVELSFGTHAPVAPLPRREQIKWLQRAVDKAWTRDELRDAINARDTSGDTESDGAGSGGTVMLTVSERIEQAARLVWRQASNDPATKDWIVPNEAMNQLAAALGESD